METSKKIEFLDILSNIWGTDIAYQESQEQIGLIMKAMSKAHELGAKSNNYHNLINWIEVLDELPPKEDDVLVYTEKGGIHVGKYRGTFWIVGNHFSFDMGEPTHWAKLPSTP